VLKEEVMICNSCSHIFNIKDAVIRYRKYGGVNMQEKKCPQCGGSFRSIQPPGDLEKYLFVNNDERYYKYN
jgi:uncharacterized Zn finger protein